VAALSWPRDVPAFGDPRVGPENGLQLGRQDVLAPNPDHALEPVVEEQQSGVIEAFGVASTAMA
jgi:hypothetical protein